MSDIDALPQLTRPKAIWELTSRMRWAPLKAVHGDLFLTEFKVADYGIVGDVFEVVRQARSITSAEQCFSGGLLISEVRGKDQRAICFCQRPGLE